MPKSFEYSMTEGGTLIRQELCPNGFDVAEFPEAFDPESGKWGELMEARLIREAEAVAMMERLRGGRLAGPST